MDKTITIRMKRPAMGCEFELVLCGADRQYLLDAGGEAFEELERLEEQLSVFRPASDISDINARAGSEPVRVDPRLLNLLLLAKRVSADTGGAFDVSSGPLIERWSRVADGLPVPTAEEIAELLSKCGMRHLRLDEEAGTVRFEHEGMSLNLGALGKGYAVGEMASLLHDRGIGAALISGGASSIYALGRPPDDGAWTVGIRHPVNRAERLTTVRLCDRSLSTSGGHERFVEANGVKYSHVVDPRTGYPAEGLLVAAVIGRDPAEGDALSTALLVLGKDGAREYCDGHAEVSALLVAGSAEQSQPEIMRIGDFP